MTAEMIHDALTLLPADLIAEADKRRHGKPRVILWRRYAAMAACFALVLCSSWFALLMFGGMGGASKETAAEAPAEAAVMQRDSVTAETQAAAVYEEEAAPEAAEEGPAAKDETLCGLPTAPAAGDTKSENNALCIDHSHHPAEEFEDSESASTGWCGNTSAVLYVGGEAHRIYCSDAITVTEILISLDYAPENLCRCIAEYTAGTETDSGYEINLTEYFVRFNGGQAALTQEQADALREIITGLGG